MGQTRPSAAEANLIDANSVRALNKRREQPARGAPAVRGVNREGDPVQGDFLEAVAFRGAIKPTLIVADDDLAAAHRNVARVKRGARLRGGIALISVELVRIEFRRESDRGGTKDDGGGESGLGEHGRISSSLELG